MTFNEIQNAEHSHIAYLVKAYRERKTLSLDVLRSVSDQIVCLDSLKFEMLQG